jgi:DNA polymerase-3 subunit gamma/tau
MSETSTAAYRVLARKYRPTRLADLVGQDALVRTLTKAMESGRLAHAFVLTGVRGVGKTTTARIIARALNCVGPDGKGGPTPDPCGVCEHCTAIAEDRHMDVIEMDAASNTGVGNIRELIDGVRYRPVSARTKVYIIDEVHMLSTSAFNALLKTLEEPPAHVKFVFATTEIRKVPVTVLSRCQRFDLRRLEQLRLAQLLRDVAGKEGRQLAEGAAMMLARAADGSARDGLSLLDRTLAHVEGEVSEAATRDLLGLVDRTQVFELFEATLGGRVPEALERVGEMYRGGADPLTVVQDLLEITHLLSRLRAVPALADDPTLPQAERERGKVLAQKLGIAALARTWSMLLKGLGEVQVAPQPLAALEMLLIRLAHAADLPSPADLVATLRDGATPGMPAAPRGGNSGGGSSTRATLVRSSAVALAVAPSREPAIAPSQQQALPQSFREAVDLFGAKREGILHGLLWNSARLVRFEPGRIVLRIEGAPRDFATRVGESLTRWTGERWIIALAGDEAGDAPLAAQEAAAAAARKARAADHPLVRAALELFPGATLEIVRGASVASALAEATTDDDSPPDLDLIPEHIDPERDEP